MMRLISEKPWVLAIVLFAVLIAAWIAMYVASRNVPMEPVPLNPPVNRQNHATP